MKDRAGKEAVKLPAIDALLSFSLWRQIELLLLRGASNREVFEYVKQQDHYDEPGKAAEVMSAIVGAMQATAYRPTNVRTEKQRALEKALHTESGKSYADQDGLFCRNGAPRVSLYSIRRVLEGHTVHSSSREEIERVAQRLGVSLPPPAKKGSAQKIKGTR